MPLQMNFSSFKVLRHLSDPTEGSFTIFQHKTNEHELFLLREEICGTEDKFRSSLAFLTRRRQASCPNLLRLYKADANPATRQIYIMMEHGLFSLQEVKLRSFESVMKCLLDVLKALAELESLGLYHGAVEPASIFYFPRQKCFRLADRGLPISAAFSFYKQMIATREELFLAPKLFNDVERKSVKSLKPNFAKLDVFAIGLISLKLLYPFVVKVGKFYRQKTRLFDTVEFVQVLSRLSRTARSAREADFLDFLRRRIVCFDESQRAGPLSALKEFQNFLKRHYENFEGTFIPQNILIEPKPPSESKTPFEAEGQSFVKTAEENKAPSAPFGPHLTFKRIGEEAAEVASKHASQEETQREERGSKTKAPQPRPPLEKTERPPSQESQKRRLKEQREDMERAGVDKTIDFADIPTPAQQSQRKIPEPEGQAHALTQESTSEGLRVSVPAPNLGQLYQVLVKIFVKKVEEREKEAFVGRLINLDEYSDFSVNFQRQGVRIKSKSVNTGLDRSGDKSEEYSYDSLQEQPLNLNLLTRSRQTKKEQSPTNKQAKEKPPSSVNVNIRVPQPKAPAIQEAGKIIQAPQKSDGRPTDSLSLPRTQQLLNEKGITVIKYLDRPPGFGSIDSLPSDSGKNILRTISSRMEGSSFVIPTPGRPSQQNHQSQQKSFIEQSARKEGQGPLFSKDPLGREQRRIITRSIAPPDSREEISAHSYRPQTILVKKAEVNRPEFKRFSFLTRF